MNEYEALIYSDELTHHGVLGMKWGIRRYQNKDGSYKSGAEGRYAQKVNSKSITPSEDYVRSRAKKRQEMSDDELKTAVQRLNNEAQYEQNINKLDPKESKLANKKETNAESEDSKNAKKHKAETMSNDELKEALDRLEKEKRYNDLKIELESPTKKWFKEATTGILKEVGNAVVNDIKNELKDYVTGEGARKQAEEAYKYAKKELDYASDLIKTQRGNLQKQAANAKEASDREQKSAEIGYNYAKKRSAYGFDLLKDQREKMKKK